jgi:hypothetical protein
MAIVGNRFYNNPAIGAAASGLANLFRPPDVSALPDVMTARAKKQEADRIAQLFTMAGDPNANMTAVDRQSIIAGLYKPTESYFAQNQNDATKRYGIGVESADRLYGFDTQAATSRANNAADNARALRLGELESSDRRYASDTQAATSQANNAADNARALRIGELGIVAAPLSEGQMRMLPADFAEAYGVPAEQRGLVKVNEGQNAVLSDGTVYRGQAKPLSMDQTTAQNAQRLYDDEAWRRFIGSGINVEMAVGEDGNPVFVARSDSFGRRPFVQQGSEAKPDIFSYRTPTGERGSAVYRDGRLVDTQTGKPLPVGSQIGKTSITGTAEDVGMGLTTANMTDINKQRMQLDYIRKRATYFKRFLEQNPDVAGIPGKVFGLAQDLKEGLASMVRHNLDAKLDASQLSDLVDRVAATKGYNPNYRKAMALAVEMAYHQTKLQDPSGEVNVREFERMLGYFDGGIAGNAGVMPFVDSLLEQVDARESSLGVPQQPSGSAVRYYDNQGNLVSE